MAEQQKIDWSSNPVDVLVDLMSNPTYGLGDSKYVAENFAMLAKMRARCEEIVEVKKPEEEI